MPGRLIAAKEDGRLVFGVWAPTAIVLRVTGEAGIDDLASRFEDHFGMVWRMPGEAAATYHVILPATEAMHAEYPERRAEMVARLGDGWTVHGVGLDPEPPHDTPLPVCPAGVDNEVRHLHGAFIEAVHRTKFRSPLDPDPHANKKIDLPEPFPALVRAHELVGDAKKIGKVLRPGIFLALGAAAEDLPVEASRIGGAPALPEDVAWPSHDGQPMTFVAQLDLASFADLDEEGILPHEGFLWLFMNRQLVSSVGAGKRLEQKLAQVIHRDGRPALALRPSPVPKDSVAARPVTARRVLTLPAPVSPHLDVDRLNGDYHAFVQVHAETVYGDAGPSLLLGHVGTPDHYRYTKKKDRQLLQVRGEDVMADGFDLIHFLMTEDDLAARAFERVRVVLDIG